MGKTLFLQCDAGISGDMTAAALLDLGASKEGLLKVLATMPLTGYSIDITRVKKSSIDCCDFNVILTEGPDNHDHDMEWLFGDGHRHDAHLEDHNQNGYNHCHHGGDHPHEDHGVGHHHTDLVDGHHHHDHHHHHRGLKEIREIIEKTQMSPRARDLALKIFGIIASAEAWAHGVPQDQVHFHEVGAVDSIVDIVSVVVLLDDLDIEQVYVPHLCEGTGTVRCQHGVLPIPVPATAHIAREHKIPMEILPVKGELVTPTGAAIVAALRTGGTPEGPFNIESIGLGAGKREYATSGILRAMIISK